MYGDETYFIPMNLDAFVDVRRPYFFPLKENTWRIFEGNVFAHKM